MTAYFAKSTSNDLYSWENVITVAKLGKCQNDSEKKDNLSCKILCNFRFKGKCNKYVKIGLMPK